MNISAFDEKMNRTLLTTKQASAAAKMPRPTFDRLSRRVTVPVVVGAGPGTAQIFTLRQTWVIAVCRAILDAGQPKEVATSVGRLLDGMTADSIDTALQEGRGFVFVVRTADASEPCPYLIRAEDIAQTPELMALKADAEKKGFAVTYFGVDVGTILGQLIEAVDAAAKKPPQKRSGKKK